MDPASDPAHSFLADIPFRYGPNESGGVEGELIVSPELLVPGTDRVRISVIASAADVITGVLTSYATAPSIALTVDLSVRIVRPITVGRISMACRVVKQGRSLASTEAWFTDGGQTVAQCWLTFMASPRPQDTLPQIHLGRDEMGPGMREPFIDALGIEQRGLGEAEVARRPYTLQPSGTIQGGVIAGLVERAAETVTFPLRPVDELDIRYLSAIRLGPGRATAELVGDDLAKVTVVDAGRDDERIASVAFTRFAPAP